MIFYEQGRARTQRTEHEVQSYFESLVEGLDEDEIEAFKAILGELSGGTSDVLDIMSGAQYEYEPVSMEQFLDDDYYMGISAQTLYPRLREELIKLFDDGRYSEVILAGSIGWGKCVGSNSIITDSLTGERHTVKEIAESTGKFLSYSFDVEKGEWGVYPAKVFRSGEKVTYKLTMTSGKSVVLSADHPVLTGGGWVKAMDVDPGVLLATPRSLPAPVEPLEISDDEVKFLAYMLANGSCSSSSFNCTLSSAEQIVEFGDVIRAMGGDEGSHYKASKATRVGVVGLQGVGSLREKWGLYNKSVDKRVPSKLFGLDDRQLALFLNRLWSTDGSVYVSGPQKIEIGLASEEFIDDIQMLLLRFGIHSRKNYAPKRYTMKDGLKSKLFDAWRLSVTGRDEIIRFLDAIGPVFSKEGKCNRLRLRVEGKKGNSNVDVTPMSYEALRALRADVGPVSNKAWPSMQKGQQLGYGRLQAICEQHHVPDSVGWWTADIFWDEVESIEEVGFEPVYDVEVPGPASWVANGILVHNTTAASFIAARILYEMLCLREPQRAYGLSPGSEIHFTLLSKNLHLAKRVLMSAVMEKIKLSPWFQDQILKSGDEEVHFQKNVVLQIGSVNSERVLGLNVFANCLTGDHLVATEHGHMRIADMAGGAYRVWTVDDGGEVYLSSPSIVQQTGVEGVVRLTLSSGQTLESTMGHRWMLESGEWVRTSDIEIGHKLLHFSASRGKLHAGGGDAVLLDLLEGSLLPDPSLEVGSRDVLAGVPGHVPFCSTLRPRPVEEAAWRVGGVPGVWSVDAVHHADAHQETRHDAGGIRVHVPSQSSDGFGREGDMLCEGQGEGRGAVEGPIVLGGGLRWNQKDARVRSSEPVGEGAEDQGHHVGLLWPVGGRQEVSEHSGGRAGNRYDALRSGLGVRAETATSVGGFVWDGEGVHPGLLLRGGGAGVPSGVQAWGQVGHEVGAEPSRHIDRGRRIEAVGRLQAREPHPVPSVQGRSGHGGDGVLGELRPHQGDLSESAEVVKVEVLSDPVPVFDVVSVPVTHRFFTGLNPDLPFCVSHNCIDEVNFMTGGKQVIKAAVGQKAGIGNYDRAEQVYTKITNRIKSRFMTGGRIPGMNILISSKTTKNSFTERRLRAARMDPAVYVMDFATWDVKSKKNFSGTTFRILVGSQTARSRILESDEVVRKDYLQETGSFIIDVPTEYKKEFELDLNASIRDVAGVSTEAIHAYLARQEAIFEAVQPELIHPFSSVEWTYGAVGKFLWGQICDQYERRLRGGHKEAAFRPKRNPKSPRHVHLDIAISGDSLGIAMGHITRWVDVVRTAPDGEQYGDLAPEYEIDFMLRVNPPKGEHIYLPDIRAMVYELMAHGFQVTGFSCDSYQSTEMIQKMKAKGVSGEVISVDRTTAPYEKLKSALYEGRLRMYDYQPFIDEALSLEYDAAKGKVDHPLAGCFTGETLVMLADGSAVRLDAMVGQEGLEVMTWDGAKLISSEAVNPRLTKWTTDLVEVTLDTGDTLRCTPDHRFMLDDGTYVEAQNLTSEHTLMSGPSSGRV